MNGCKRSMQIWKLQNWSYHDKITAAARIRQLDDQAEIVVFERS